MVVINSISDKYFTLDGIQFAKIYQPLAQGSEAIGIYSIYDTRKQLVNSTRYSEFTINGVTYTNQADAIKAILQSTWAGISGYDVEDLQNRVDNLEENQVTGVVVYETYAELPATGTLLVSYKVSNDTTDSNNGYWHWSGSAYVKDLELNQNITDTVTDLENNKSIFADAVNSTSLTKYHVSTSTTPLGSTYDFGSDGDYVEFEVRLDGDITTGFNALGLVGNDTSTIHNMGWVSSTEFRVRDSGAWVAFTGLTPYSELGDVVKVKVLVNGTNFELYFNDVLVKTVAKGSFTTMEIDRIGNAYKYSGSVSLFSMKNFNLHTSASGDLVIAQIWKADLKHVDITVAPDTNKGLVEVVNPKVIVEFDPTGGIDSEGEFLIYCKTKETEDYYVQFVLVRVIDATTRRDNWNIRGAYMFRRNKDGSWVDLSQMLLNIGETEFVYKHVGASDFTGGFHGDQILTNVDFFINGVRLPSSELASSFELECNEFSFIQHSEMYETDNITDIVEANSIKHDIFTEEGLEIRVRHIWAAVVDIDLCYNCLVPTFFNVADYYTNELYEIIDVTDGAPDAVVLVGNERFFRCWNEDTGIACEVDVVFGEEKTGAHSQVWSNPPNYNKLYVSYVPSGYDSSVDEVFTSNVKISFKKNLQ